ncbi:HEAT repeat-containing protein 5A-like [Carassius carassius]|uniref:HEAT repeat-containing protein 5A-like n=1 Tax=Carassius carassius TaxID=217509 RepID=UPI002868BC89|nr:HEAT repeat-containing protein 5A-like [Carassius carassius]
MTGFMILSLKQTCVVFVSILGGAWLENHFSCLLSLLMVCVSHGRATQYSADAVPFILMAALGTFLGKKAQIATAKEICQLIRKQKRVVDAALHEGNMEIRVSPADVTASQHVLVCALLELGSLLQDPSIGMLDTVISVLLRPSSSARLAAAWCLWCVAVGMPAQLTSVKDVENEQRHGDSFTWQVTLEGRAGALSKESGGALRVYEILTMVQPKRYEESFDTVLKQLLNDLTGPEITACAELNLRAQFLEQFCEFVHQLKGARLETVQIHVAAAFCCTLKLLLKKLNRRRMEIDDDSSAFLAKSESSGPFNNLRWSTHFLVLHLADRMALIAATDHSDQLRLAGLQTLLVIIQKFFSVPEPEFPGHIIQTDRGSNFMSRVFTRVLKQLSIQHNVSSAYHPESQGALERYHQTLKSMLRHIALRLVRIGQMQFPGCCLPVERARSSPAELGSDLSRPTSDKSMLLSVVVEESDETESNPPRALIEGRLNNTKMLSVLADHLPHLTDFEKTDILDVVRQFPELFNDVPKQTHLIEHDIDVGTTTPIKQHPYRVCSAWIASGVISDLRDLRRVHQLLASSLAKAQSLGRGVYHSGTGLQAAIFSSRMMRLGLQVQQGLVCSNWSRLSRLWLAALQDHALLTLPSQYSSQLPSTGISVEFLCSPHSGDQMEKIVSCLQALQALLEVYWPRSKVGNDQKASTAQPKLAGSPTGQEGQTCSLSNTDCRLVTSALAIFSELPSICSPEEAVKGSVGAENGQLVPGIPQALSTVLSSPMSRAEKSLRAWTELLRCALHSGSSRSSLSHQTQSVCVCVQRLFEEHSLVFHGLFWMDKMEPGVDEVTVLTSLTIFLLYAIAEVTTEYCSLLSCSLAISHLGAERSYQWLVSLFQGPVPVARPFILALGGCLVSQQQEVEKSHLQGPAELQALHDAIRALEALVFAADETHCPQLVAVLLLILISLQLDENALASAPAASRSLHESALGDLMRIGPQHSAVFNALMASTPHMKARLQATIKGNQESMNTKAQTTRLISKNTPSI